jgi:hypothetical protein
VEPHHLGAAVVENLQGVAVGHAHDPPAELIRVGRADEEGQAEPD